MIKLREARYCNLKLFLIFLVIYSHLIEPQIWTDNNLMEQYRWIYFVHIPLFSFLSGLFINDCRSCAAQLKRLGPLYIVLQMIAVLLGNGMVTPMTPFWHLWYLLSYLCWLGIAWLLLHFTKGNGKILILILSLIVGCFSGYVSIIGRVYSLSRTIVFFPYFWLGIICDRKFEWRKYRMAGVNTLPAYIIHAPVVAVMRELNWSGLIYVVASAALLWLIFKLSQWHSSMYGIVVPERRDGWWPLLKRCMKNMAGKYIDFCYLYPEVKP